MKPRPHGFLHCSKLPHDSEIFDYIVELHELLWRVVRVISPGASGQLDNHLPDVIDRLEASSVSRPNGETP